MASIVTSLLGGGALNGIANIINSIRGKSPEDADKMAELVAKYQSEILAADVQSRQAQADVNKVEAASNNMFVAGWRPGVGWTCGLGLFVQFVVRPFAIWGAALAGHNITFPDLDMGTLVTLLFGMLGLGSLRTYEKVNGVSSGH